MVTKKKSLGSHSENEKGNISKGEGRLTTFRASKMKLGKKMKNLELVVGTIEEKKEED